MRHRRVIDADPHHVPALRSLDRLYLHTQRWGDLADILRRRRNVAEGPDEALEFEISARSSGTR